MMRPEDTKTAELPTLDSLGLLDTPPDTYGSDPFPEYADWVTPAPVFSAEWPDEPTVREHNG